MATMAGFGETVGRLFVSPKSIAGRLARNTIWSVTGSATYQCSSLLAALLVARLLGVTDFGKLALIQATVLLTASVGELGLGLTTTKFVGRWRKLDPERTGRVIGCSLRITVISAFSMGILAVLLVPYLLPKDSGGLSREMLAAGVWLFFETLNRVQIGALAGLEAFDRIARVQITRALLILPCIGFGAWFFGLVGAILALGLVSAVIFVLTHLVVAGRCRSLSIPVAYRASLEPGVLTTSASLWLSGLLMAGSTWAVSLILSHNASGLSELGIYVAADKWKMALLFVPSMLFQVSLPMLSHTHAEGEYKACRRLVYVVIGSTAGLTSLAAIVISALAPFLMSTYGSDFSGGANVLVLASVVGIVSALYTVGSGVLWAMGRPTRMLKIDILKAVVLLGGCWAGLAGSAWHLMLAYLISFTVGSAVVLAAVKHQLATDKKLETHADNR